MILNVFLLILNVVASKSFLNINSWTLTNGNGSITLNNVISPIDVYSALYKNNLINWPLKGYNDLAYRWIAYDNWTFTSNPFFAPESSMASVSVSGLDVYPLLTLNNNFINGTTSEFSSAEILINPNILRRSNNILRIHFMSPPILGKIISNHCDKKILPDCWPDIFHGECHINFLRKTQSSFGWDWGPAIPTMGIRGEVNLRLINKTSAVLNGVRFLSSSDNYCKEWTAEVVVKLRISEIQKSSIFCIKMKMENLEKNMTKCIKTNGSMFYYVSFPFKVDSTTLKLWWPYEMGTPVLYKLEVYLTDGSFLIEKYIEYVGFRRVDLDQSLIPGFVGRRFQFSINCKRFFVKGTNWVPRSYLSTEWKNTSHLEFLLYSIRDGNINTIRLWGGGRPETQLFYSIVDRLGIMIWHDFMFAGSLYPNNKEFLDLIETEVTDQLWSIQKHPSISIWSGNNEVEVLIAQGWYKPPMDPQDIKDYYKIFSQIIKPLVKRLDPFIPFVLSSPSNGIESEVQQGVSKDPQSLYYGDVHFYLYSGELWDERSYPVSRMTTEFGFQSLPNPNVWELVIESDDDFDLHGSLIKHRQHHSNGMEQMEKAIIQYFGKTEPFTNNTVRVTYTWFSYLSQINQAMILKSHINRLRTSQCSLSKTSEGLTSGAMFWQINDNWVAPSWSTIEWNGQWKLAQYFVRTAFSEERIIVVIQDEIIIVKIILPDPKPLLTYDVVLTCVDISKNVLQAVTGQKSFKIDAKALPCNVGTVFSMRFPDFLAECKCGNAARCLVDARLKNNGKSVSHDETLFVKPKELDLPKNVVEDIISMRISQADPDVSLCLVTLSPRFVHLFVTLSTNSLGIFSKNGFHLWDKEYNVTFSPWYFHKNEFFDCKNLHIELITLNKLII